MATATLEPRYQPTEPAARAGPAGALNESVRRLGFWAAVLTAVFGVGFIVGGVLGMVAAPPRRPGTWCSLSPLRSCSPPRSS
jgi:hypothetical protein